MRTALLFAIGLALLLMVPVASAPGPPPGFGREWYDRALELAESYRMFGAFAMDEGLVEGTFVSLEVEPSFTVLSDYTVTKPFGGVVVFERIDLANPSQSTVTVNGSLLEVSSPEIRIRVHNTPLGVVHVEAPSASNTVTFTLGPGMNAVESGGATFVVGNGLRGGIVALGGGAVDVVGNQVIATLPASASVSFRAHFVAGEGVVGSAEQDALLDALVAGILAVEDLSVALEGGVAQETIEFADIEVRVTQVAEGVLEVVVDASLPSGRAVALYLHRELLGPGDALDLAVELDGVPVARAGSAPQALAGPVARSHVTESEEGALVIVYVPSFSVHSIVLRMPDPLPLYPFGAVGLLGVIAAIAIVATAAWVAIRRERKEW